MGKSLNIDKVRRQEEHKVTLKFNTSEELMECIKKYADNVVGVTDYNIITWGVDEEEMLKKPAPRVGR